MPQVIKAFKFELSPSSDHLTKLDQFAGAARYVFNKTLDARITHYKTTGKSLSLFDTNKLLTQWKKDKPWLKEAPSQALQQAQSNLDQAYKRFFAYQKELKEALTNKTKLPRKVGFPQFKKKHKTKPSLRFPQGTQLDQQNGRIFLPKLGWIRYRNSREVLGVVKNVTVSKKCDKWYVSIQTEQEVEQPIHPSNSMIGVDLGIARFATMSDGSFIEPKNSLKKHLTRLKRYQRAMSRKKKGSQNKKKAAKTLAKLYERVANIRNDHLHQVSTKLSKSHAVIVIEDLKVSNMSKSAKGTVAEPGKRVSQKRGLNRSILDQGWYELRRQLQYKQEKRGGLLIVVPAAYTSQTCPECGCISKENRKTQARFCCISCGYTENADVVGAKNILARGIELLSKQGQDDAQLACREDIRLDERAVRQHSSLKQESAESIQAVIQA